MKLSPKKLHRFRKNLEATIAAMSKPRRQQLARMGSVSLKEKRQLVKKYLGKEMLEAFALSCGCPTRSRCLEP